ncbi:alpha/beta hydrolase [Prosthecobacter vanneervenii]|uniref:Pimeloyl-ACP methyl ester carboxylesterase n=1 Tax=Prosthecobacter vanneervenii TaxID=48466 RepID=A0A7W8DMC0_9BACT|nr:alpha/beta hydrolase [Prosthecobacter vanneervenii]MBB5034761.1 pimeloyl-ACP methyl ester carboxylesterase [Prosthecobacter vanneervenii]
MTQERLPIYLIPGLGADRRNYPDVWTELPGCTRLEWEEYHGPSSVPEVARFMAEKWQLPPGAVLVGSSFGGIVACEIAKFLPVHAVVLVASSTSGRDFVTTGRMKLLTRVLPLRLVQTLLRRAQPWLEFVWGRGGTPLTRAVLDSMQMFCACQAAFYRGMFDAISSWEGADTPNARVIRIHGKLDKLVNVPAHADAYLNGGHMIGMTHAHECVDFIKCWLQDQRQVQLWHAI